MRAVRVSGPGVVDVVDIPEPAVVPGEILVEVEAAALCATDRKLVARGANPPRVPGHEVAGRLEDGTLVGVHPDIGCGRCSECRAGFENRCRHRVSIGLDRDGGLAEWVSVPREHVVPVDGVEVDLAPLLEPLACCVHAVSLLAVRTGDRALVVGAGPMGVLCTWVLQTAGASVAVSQRSVERRHLARVLGADAVLGPEEDPADALGGEPRLAIVTAPGPEPLEWTLAHLAVGGVAHAFAGAPDGAKVDVNLVHYRQLTLVGSTGSTRDDYARALELVVRGDIDLSRLPRSRIELEEVPAALLAEPGPRELKVHVDVSGG